MTEFRPFPTMHAAYDPDIARYLGRHWPALTDDIVRGFFQTACPWSLVLWGRPGTGKSMLSDAFTVLAGGGVRDYPRSRGLTTLESATCRLRVADEVVSAGFLLYGQRSAHTYDVARTGEVVVYGYGRALGTTSKYEAVWNDLKPLLVDFVQAEGIDHPTREVTQHWVRSSEGAPGALVRHLAWMGQ